MKSAWITSAAILVVALTPANSKSKPASCDLMQKLAQEHASDMARREPCALGEILLSFVTFAITSYSNQEGIHDGCSNDEVAID